jgi:hypothetical protein
MRNNNTQYRIDEFFVGYEEHLNKLLSGNSSSFDGVFTEKVMELGPLGILYSNTKEKQKRPENSVQLISSDTRILDGSHAICKVQWNYHEGSDKGETEVEFYVFYLLKILKSQVRIFASITGDEEGLHENGLRSLYKLYIYEKRKQYMKDQQSTYEFSAN